MSQMMEETVHDDLEAYVLGALDPEDEQRFVAHLETCQACRDGIASYVGVTNALRTISVAVPPPLRMGAPAPIPLRRRPAAFVAAYAAAAAVLLGLGAGLHAYLQPNNQPIGDRDLLAVAGMMADGPRQAVFSGGGVRGRVIIGRRNLRAAVVLRGLPEPPAGSTYDIWVGDNAPVMVGALRPARDHLEVLLLDAGAFASAHDVEVSLDSPGAHSPGTQIATARL
jgi:anti-sigma factor RsiW